MLISVPNRSTFPWNSSPMSTSTAATSRSTGSDMNREFLDFYNRELSLLYEQAGGFAEEFPGIAERLGGLIRDRSDPMITGLLEGAAFLAARVQLKLAHEFPEFTANLL